MKRSSIGITGGIGSGKSFVCSCFERLGIPVFYTDREARMEMIGNENIHAALRQILHADILRPDGSLDKALLSAFISRGSDEAALVDSIVHPCVRQRFRLWRERLAARVAVMECALLFESGFDSEVSASVFVSAPLEVRINRVMKRDGKSRNEVLQWMSLQMDEDEKMSRADYTVVNDGMRPILPQVEHILSVLAPLSDD